MRHAFLNSEINFKNLPKGFKFKTAKCSQKHSELAKWPLDISAKEAKEELSKRGMKPVLLSKEGIEVPMNGSIFYA